MCPARISASALDAGQLRWRDEGEEQRGQAKRVKLAETMAETDASCVRS